MALISCAECEKEISDQASVCPGCGAPVGATTNNKDRVPYSDAEVHQMLAKRKKTSHLLHLVMSILTFGVWILVWILVAVSNANENAKIDRKINKGKKTPKREPTAEEGGWA